MDRTSMNLFERASLMKWSFVGASEERMLAAKKFEENFIIARITKAFADEKFEDIMARGEISKEGINELFTLRRGRGEETYFRDRDNGTIVIVDSDVDSVVVVQPIEDQELLGWLLLFCQPKGDGLGIRAVLEHITSAEGRSIRGGNDSVLLVGEYPKELTELLLDIHNVDMPWEKSEGMEVEELPEDDNLTRMERYVKHNGLHGKAKHLFDASQNRFDVSVYLLYGQIFTSDEVMVGMCGAGLADYLRYILLGFLVSFDTSGKEYWISDNPYNLTEEDRHNLGLDDPETVERFNKLTIEEVATLEDQFGTVLKECLDNLNGWTKKDALYFDDKLRSIMAELTVGTCTAEQWLVETDERGSQAIAEFPAAQQLIATYFNGEDDEWYDLCTKLYQASVR